ncbi:penicillin-binding protein 1F [Paenibacillus baekrokdamisoli]|uniref:Penicillin-binding protein 1F n=1 Tax=Paenibacillus baekrokdamisoli TaxID=1712516 RepID=A0A3G9J7J6_9BACL|nr:PBP1A family penicillin-binding protein [Paenibacillus baekrokdamisoli]MBB3067032.1 penicillin-binding protein 2A [Paenibacillus baekrokdamisoli]BBH19778.1 penicillin-binding protein 1F [Paenibacillus baekrokdamisoli]
MTDERSTKKKVQKKKGKRKFSGRKLLIWMFFTGAVAVICGIIGYMLIILNGERILSENQDKFILPEASTIYDSGGHEIMKFSTAGGNRENVEYAEIPKLVRDAVIATEDKRFEEHKGIDLWSIGRALVKDVVTRSAAEGGSTITQQLAKNLFLTRDKTIFRKATEASIAVALENKKTKDEILTMYLNRIYYGKGVYGIKAAAKYYFDKPLDQLKIWEIATLTGIPKAPTAYNPISNPEKSADRRNVVLQLMFEQGYITKAQLDEAKTHTFVPTQHSVASDTYPAYMDYLVSEAEAKTGLTEEQLRIGGYNIYTTLNTNAQSIMEKEFADDSNFEKSVDDQQVQGAMIIIDHRDGNIQGLVGGRDYEKKGTNRVLVPRQPGSGFKPITVYGPAIETGDYFPWSIVQDVKQCYGNYCPSDSNGNKYIGPITIRQSIKESRNASAVWLLNEIGVKTGLKFADKLGFSLDSKNDRNLAIGLGGLTNGVTPLEMATAYSVFANGGKSVDPHSLLKIVDGNDQIIYQYKAPDPVQLMKPETAYYMTDIMQGVLEKGGTGTRARIDRPVAGKTGTTQHGIPNYRSSYNRDAWFSGYTAEWTGVVWMGYDHTDKNHLLKKSSSQSAAMFGKVMGEAMKDVPKSSFPKPKDVEQQQPPAGVTNLSAIYDQQNVKVKLIWAAAEGSGLTYRVYRKEATETAFTRLMDAVSTTGVDDMSVAPGMSYTYYVTTYDANHDIEGTPSGQVSIEIPAEQLTPVDPGNNGGTPNNGGTTPGDTGGTPGDGTQTPGNGNGNPDNGNGQDPGTTDPGTGNNGQTPGSDGQTPGNSGTGGTNGTGTTGTGGTSGGTSGTGGTGTTGGTSTTPSGDGTASNPVGGAVTPPPATGSTGGTPAGG